MFVRQPICPFDLDDGPYLGVDFVGAILKDPLLAPFREDGLKID